jgi:hypothetical protein
LQKHLTDFRVVNSTTGVFDLHQPVTVEKDQVTMNRHARRLMSFVAVLLGLLPIPNRLVFADLDAPSVAASIAHSSADSMGEGFDCPDSMISGLPACGEELISGMTTGDEAWTWQLLPDGLMYKSYIAGEKEPRISNSFLFQSGGDTLWDTALGWRVGLIRFGATRAVQPEGFQLDVEGGTFLRALSGQANDMRSMDLRVGIPLTWREGPFQVKVSAYHLESHVGDDFLLENPGFIPNGYSRTALVAGVGYFVLDSLRLYSEVGWSVSGSGGDKPWEWQSGLEWSTPDPTGLRGAPYFAANVHLRETTFGSGSVNVMAGWQWRRSKSDHYFRAGLQYFNGKNNQYSFLQDTQQLFGFGLRYDY